MQNIFFSSNSKQEPFLSPEGMKRGVKTQQQQQQQQERRSSDSDGRSVKEGFFWADIDSTWTVLDQKRLVSMDYLYHRSLEFHNNHHTFRATGDFDYTKALENLPPHEIVCEILEFRRDSTVQQPRSIIYADLESTLNSYQLPERGITWFNVKDLRALAAIGKKLDVHPIPLSHFYDLRGHSAISAIDDGLFVSFCTMVLSGDDAEMHKIYTFNTKRFVISYERELICEPDDDDEDSQSTSPTSPSNGLSAVGISVYEPPHLQTPPTETASVERSSLDTLGDVPTVNQTRTRDGDVISPLSPLGSPTVSVNRHNTRSGPGHKSGVYFKAEKPSAIRNLISRMTQEVYDTVCTRGAFYMMYEIGTEVLTESDSLIEFISRTIFYLKQQVHRRISYKQKLHFHRKVGILLAVIKMMDRLVDEIHQNLQAIMNKTSSQFEILSASNHINWEHLVFISCLVDSYVFKSTCLERQLHDVLAVENAMSHVTSIRSEYTQTNLALIGTVFLPMTFLAGVYGMNFQEDGGYTDKLLNYKHGLIVFWGLCGVVILINLYLFTRSGLVTWQNDEGILSTKSPRWESMDCDDLTEVGDQMRASSVLSFNDAPNNEIASVDEKSLFEEYRRSQVARNRRILEARHR
eukprot:CAMPEP_0185028282 /NCGR_PEP_ID=MMETSP1103-20130426/13937_1 /TAXON_ID=36769 /ORGANISM="Paraphysomonas bandaiensis, Strain Caron Lab Isolate" /LENGTH=633 /DNA_ID=CAMNT_0027562657 /DNA_START=9 /DNA_END=1910 /DNA_ORIENTATION=-